MLELVQASPAGGAYQLTLIPYAKLYALTECNV